MAMLRPGSTCGNLRDPKRLTSVNTDGLAEVKSFEDIKKLSVRDVNQQLKSHGVNIQNLRLEEKRIKLGQVLNVSVVGNSDIHEIISKGKSGWTKDIKKIPLVTIEKVKEYLIKNEREGNSEASGDVGMYEKFSDSLLARYKTSRSYDLWASGNLHSFELNLLSESDRMCLIRCKSNASWTTGKVYETSVVVDKLTAKPFGAYCLCVAGAGQACSHTAGLLFGLADFISQGIQTLPDGPATTEQLAYWINPKGSKVQPKVLQKLRIEKKLFYKTPRKKQIRAFQHDPRHPKDRHVNFDDYLELMSSLRECKPNAPVLQIYQPSKFRPQDRQFHYKSHSVKTLPDFYTISDSHDPMIPSHEEVVLTTTSESSIPNSFSPLPPSLLELCENVYTVEALKVSIKRSAQDVKSIEVATRRQANNQVWFNYRKGMITSSVAHSVNTAVKGKKSNVDNLVQSLLGNSSFSGNNATRYGQTHEQIAIENFQEDMTKKHINARISYTGLFVHACGYLAASPDGLLQCDCCQKSLIEVKCPLSLMQQSPVTEFSKTQFLKKIGDEVRLSETHRYYTQVQMQMGVTGIFKTHFIVWSPVDYFHSEIVFDHDFWSTLEKNMSVFFDTVLGPSCLKAAGNTSSNNVKEQVKCGGCLLDVKDEGEIASNKEASVQCDCYCACKKWYHWKCVKYNPDDYDELEECEWFCPSCVQNCDIIY